MIYDVFLPFIIFFSFFGIVVILARKIPYISLEVEVKKDWLSEQEKKQHETTVLFCKVLSVLEKTLRQIRIHILKLDAKIFNLIQYLRDKSAKKLEEINKLSYKSFGSTVQKKTDKPKLKSYFQVKMPVQEAVKTQIQSEMKFETQHKVNIQSPMKDMLPKVSVVDATTKTKSPFKTKIVKTTGQLNKISNKFQFNIEERKLLHIIAKSPKIAENYKKLGMLYYKNENLPDAEAAFGEYLKLNPSDLQAGEVVKEIVIKNQGKN